MSAALVKKRLSGLSRNALRGFLLVEIIVVVIILSAGIIGVLRSYIISVTALKITKDALSSLYLAKQKIDDIKQDAKRGNGIAEGFYDEGVFERQDNSFKWQVEIISAGEEELNEIKAAVFNENARPLRKVNLVSYVENKKK